MKKMIMAAATACTVCLNGCSLLVDPVWQSAAIDNNDSAQYVLGYNYENGIGVERDECEAVKWYKKAAENGNGAGAYSLGLAYSKGQCIERDDKKAFFWLQMAASHGIPGAQWRTGLSYMGGWGVARNYNEAVYWFKQAASQGYLYAATDLGICYFNGLGVAENRSEGIKWWLKAADQDDRAKFYLGGAYLIGTGVEHNYAKGMSLLKAACTNSYKDACNAIQGIGTGRKKGDKEACYILKSAGRQ